MYAVSDRVSGLFSRVLEFATKHMDTLIDALDDFDSISRRHHSPFRSIRTVMEATQACIASSAKSVIMLKLQIPVIRGSDPRYTRTLLLMVYGSMAEMSCSWKAMTPLLTQVRKIIGTDLTIQTRQNMPGAQKMSKSMSNGPRQPISPIAETTEFPSPASAGPLPTPIGGYDIPDVPAEQDSAPSSVKRNDVLARSRDRRLAGSFSHQDVERGMLMPSPGPNSSLRTMRSAGLGGHRQQDSTSTLEAQTEVSEDEEGMEEMPGPYHSRITPNAM